MHADVYAMFIKNNFDSKREFYFKIKTKFPKFY